MGRQYIVIATICYENAALWTTLIGTSISSTRAFEMMHDFDYKKIIAEDLNIAQNELVYDHCTKSFGSEGVRSRYDEDHIVRNSEELNDDTIEVFIHLSIFED